MNRSRITDVFIIRRVYRADARAGISLIEGINRATSRDSVIFGRRLSTLDFAAVVGSGSTISFLSPTATLKVETLGAFGSTILGFAKGDTIDVAPVPFGLATMLNFAQTGSGGTLTVSDGTHSSAFSLTGSYNTAGFHMASDNHGGTAVTFS